MLLALFLAFVLGIAWLVCLVGAGMLVSRGVRGRLLDHHPRCRHCGYDLVGSPQRPDRCPECGACLIGIAKVRIGQRRVRPIPVIVGVAIGLLALSPIVMATLPLIRAQVIAVAPVPALAAPPTLYASPGPPALPNPPPPSASAPAALTTAELATPFEFLMSLPADPHAAFGGLPPVEAATAADEPVPESEAGFDWLESRQGDTRPVTRESTARKRALAAYDHAILGTGRPRGAEAGLEQIGAPAAAPPTRIDRNFGGVWFDANWLGAWRDSGFTAGSYDIFGHPVMPFGAPPANGRHGEALIVDPLGNPTIRTRVRSDRFRDRAMTNPVREAAAGGRGKAKGRSTGRDRGPR